FPASVEGAAARRHGRWQTRVWLKARVRAANRATLRPRAARGTYRSLRLGRCCERCIQVTHTHVPRRVTMATATWIRDELEQQGIAFEERHHPDSFTAQEVAQNEHVSGHRVAKVVCVLADGQPVELVLPASRRVVLDWVRDLLRARECRL